LKRPYLNWRDPVVVPHHGLSAFVSGGCWVCLCPCGNAPAVDPEWRLAACFECGAIYHGIDVPKEWRNMERVLVARPKMAHRNAVAPPESVDSLVAENEAHGDPVPDDLKKPKTEKGA